MFLFWKVFFKFGESISISVSQMVVNREDLIRLMHSQKTGIWINSSACGGPAQSTVRLVNFIGSRHGIRVVMHPGEQKDHQDSP